MRVSQSTPLPGVLRIGAGLRGVEGRRTCQKTRKAVSSQLDKVDPKGRKGGWGKPRQSFDFLIDIAEIALYVTASSTKKRVISIWRVGLKVSGGNVQCGTE